ncbi:MAG: hypothetical protein ACK2UB_07385 [Anaerolineales bacterium]
MKEEMELNAGQPEGAGEINEQEQEDLHRLDGVTYEPEAAVERTGDYREAEAIQGALSAVAEPGRPPKDDSGVELDGKGERPSDTVSLDGKGNDLKAGEVVLDAPQTAVQTNNPSPAFTLDGKGADRSPDSDGKIPSTTPRTPERSGASGQGETSALERGVDDGGANIQFRIQEATNDHNNSETTRSDVKKKKDSTEEDLISKIG